MEECTQKKYPKIKPNQNFETYRPNSIPPQLVFVLTSHHICVAAFSFSHSNCSMNCLTEQSLIFWLFQHSNQISLRFLFERLAEKIHSNTLRRERMNQAASFLWLTFKKKGSNF
ncbi:hypothetical protein ABFX02_02G021000 [Erythranthe guttata]